MLGVNNIEYLSQRDPRWSNIKIGSSDITIGRYGCLITCLAMASDYFGCKMTPAQIASVAHNFMGPEIAWINLDFPAFSFRWRESDKPNPFSVQIQKIDMAMIDSYMAGNHGNANRLVLLEVANHSHWVLALWKNYGDYLAIDPWTGTTCEVLQKYGNITGAALLVKWDKNQHGGHQAFYGQNKPLAPLYN